MDQPPSQNPLKQMYDEWSTKTPFITRNSLIGIVVLYILSFFFSADVTLGNIPYFSLMHFEIYRIVLAPVVGNSVITILLMIFFYPSMGTRMESSLGSAGYLFHLFLISLVTNILFDMICLSLYMVGTPEALFWSCSGFWTILFALIVVECMQMPDVPRRFLCFPIDIPSKYYPLALYAFFCLFSGFQIDLAVSMLVGYMSSKGLLDRLNLSSTRLAQMESAGCLASLSRSSGWIPVQDALGMTVYTGEAASTREADAGASSWLRGGPSNQTSAPGRPAPAAPFPGSGRTLATAGPSSSMWSGAARTPQESGPGVSLESRQALAARRLAALSGTSEGGEKSPYFAGASAPPVRIDAAMVSTLKGMGYSEQDATRALRESGGSIEGAIEILSE